MARPRSRIPASPLYALFWAALPMALTNAGEQQQALIEFPLPLTKAHGGSVKLADGPKLDIHLRLDGDFLAAGIDKITGKYLSSVARILPGPPEAVAAEVAREIAKYASDRRARIARNIAVAEMTDQAAALAATAGRKADGTPALYVVPVLGEGFYPSLRVPLSAEQMQATVAFWRGLGVLPEAPGG